MGRVGGQHPYPSAPVSGYVRRVGGFGGAAVFGVEALGFLELVFEDDDAAGGLDGGAVVDEFPGAGGDAQLVAGVAAVAALGPQGGDQPGFADGSEEARRSTDHLGGATHGVGGEVVIVESIGGLRWVLLGHLHLFLKRVEGPRCIHTGAPRGINTICRRSALAFVFRLSVLEVGSAGIEDA